LVLWIWMGYNVSIYIVSMPYCSVELVLIALSTM
jgi:hypothetical protein